MYTTDAQYDVHMAYAVLHPRHRSQGTVKLCRSESLTSLSIHRGTRRMHLCLCITFFGVRVDAALHASTKVCIGCFTFFRKVTVNLFSLICNVSNQMECQLQQQDWELQGATVCT